LHLSFLNGIIKHAKRQVFRREEIAMRMKTESRFLVSLLLTFCLLILPVTALAKKGEKNFKAGMKYEANQQWEKAAQEFTLALAADPSNSEYHLHFRRSSFNASQAYMQQGRALAEHNDFVGAYNAFRQAYGYDPVNELAVSEMERMLRLQQVKEGNNSGNGTKSAETHDANGTPMSAPDQEQVASSAPQQMRIISFSGDLKTFIRKLADELNLNVIFDRQSFVSPKNIDINLRDVTTSQALDYIFLQEGLFFQKLSRRTIVVADQTRRPQYQQLVLRTFYLANTDPEKAKQLVSQAIPPSVGRPQTIAVADKDTNSLTVRDTAENVRLIGELIESIDKDRAEVVMDVNIYEVSKSNFLQFGNQIGTGTFNLGGSPGVSILSDNGTIARRGEGDIGRGVNLTGLVGSIPTALAAAFVLPPSVFTAFQSKNNTKLIASTQVHAFNNEESTARIGQRVPVQTAQAYPFGVQTGAGTGTGTGGFPTGGFPVINYEPTGLTLKFTPQVFPNQDVQVKMSIESKDVLGASTLTPTFTERTITGTARVQNNRTMMLASVSQDVQTNGRQGLPILGLIPVLGRLFTSPTNDNRRIDIVIAVTPRVLRAPAVTPRDLEMRPSGTLQSPTTGSLEAMLREADQEDRLAAAQLEKRNAMAKAAAPADASSAPVTAKNEQTAPASNAPVANSQTVNPPAANIVATATTDAAVTKDPGVFQSTAAPQQTVAAAQTPAAPSGEEELSSFVPAPKSLVSSQSASEVAAINTNLNTGANAVLTSLSKQIETSVNAVTPPARTAQISLNTGDEILKVGEKRWVTLKLNSDVSLALGTVAFRFDPKILKVRTVSVGTLMARVKSGPEPSASITQSIDPAGICLVSISNLNGVASIKGEGVLLFIEVEALAPGDAGITFEKAAMHFVGTDARDVVVEVSPVRAMVRQ
jgi:general secretion pathway protein D